MLKHVALISTSSVALLSELRDVRPVILPDTVGETSSAITTQERHLLGPLLWVFEFFVRFFGGQPPSEARVEVFESNSELYRAHVANRKYRRFDKRYPALAHLPISKRYGVYLRLFGRNITRARFRELYAVHGNWSRVIAMGFRRQKFRKFEPRAQINASFRAIVRGGLRPATASTSDGLWAVQLPPN